MPPSNVVEWSGGGTTNNWGTGANWVGNSLPNSTDHVLFGDVPTSGTQPTPTDDAIRQTVNLGSSRTVRSLWFKAGLWYTLEGPRQLTQLTLGQGATEPAPYLLVVNKGDAGEQSEINIETNIKIANVSDFGRIENYSEGGLRIGGIFNLNGQNIRIGGTGATHFAKTLLGAGIIEVGTGSGHPAQLILSGDNKDWSGSLKVNASGFAIIKADQAIGTSSAKHVLHGGTLALRSHVGEPLTYNVPQEKDHPVEVQGHGVVRAAGTAQIGAIYNDGGQNSFNMKIIMKEEPGVSFGSRGDRSGGLDLRNQVSGQGPFIKVGPGLITLSYAGDPKNEWSRNSWSKDTIIRGGVLRIGHANALPSDPSGPTSNLVLDGGILELGYGDFIRGLGTGANQIRWTGSGGFSAYGADRSVTIGGGGMLTWGSTANFVGDGHALLLGSRYANADITLTNAINLGLGGSREVRVERGEGNAHAILSGGVSGTGGLLKTGDGLLRLTGNNSYSGATVIRGGSLRGNIDNDSNIQLGGGVLGIDGDFTRELGFGPNQVRWDGSGGFAAYGGTHTVTFGEAAWALVWGETGGFVAGNQELRFGHYTATGTVAIDRMIYLGTGEAPRVIRIERGRELSRADVVFNGAIDGSSDLWFVGNGRIDLTSGDNFSQNIGPIANIYGAEVRLTKNGRLLHQNLTIGYGGTLFLDDLGTHDSETGGSGHSNRIRDDAILYLDSGTITYQRGGSDVENIGTIWVREGQNAIQVSKPEDGQAILHAVDLSRSEISHRSVLHFSAKEAVLRFANFITGHNVAGMVKNGDILERGTDIIPWATAIRTDGSAGFAQGVTEAGFVDGYSYHSLLKALEDYDTHLAIGWDATLNVRMTANQTLNENRTINSLIIRGGNLSFQNSTLTINSGGLISNGTSERNLNGSGQLTTNNSRPLYVHTFGDLLVLGSLRFSGGMDLVKSQSGTLTLNSSGTHTVGSVYIHRGTLDLPGGTLDLPGGTLSVNDRITIGDGSGNATLRLAPDRWNQIVKTGGGLPNITLRGTPYDPRGPEYGGAQAILQLGGNTKQVLANLHIEHRGTIDWAGGEVAKANILWIDTLTFSGRDAQLFIRNWYEYEDILLVRNNFDRSWLKNIIFEGYQNYETTWKQWDNNYIQITPFGIVPEPSTYGALLGALGLAAVVWRKRGRKAAPTPQPDGVAASSNKLL